MTRKMRRKIEKAITYMITGLACGFILTSIRGLEGDNFIVADLLLVLSYGWCVLLYWANFIHPLLMRDKRRGLI